MALTLSGTDGLTLPNEQAVVSAWVNFNGSGTVAIRDDGNVGSITDNSVGNYTVNFSNSQGNSSYCCNMTAGDDTSTAGMTNGFAYGSWKRGTTSAVYTTGSMRIGVGYPANSTYYDQCFVNVSIIGD